ncbi:MAG: hypothetical protein KTR17_01235 [Cellvibrionaceae bacterium]|nr:hypothetical protein [Cellvibrionaceae bacterium]
MITLRHYRFVVLWLMLFLSTVAFSQELQRLEDVRDEIIFPELTLQEKVLLVEQTKQFFESLYVNRLDKFEFYPELEDQLPVIDELLINIEDVSTAEMELQLFDIFASQRDLHLNYIFPSPYNQYRSLLPLTFTRTLENPYIPQNKILKYSQVRVDSVNAELFASFAEGETVPAIGDTLVYYNKKRVKQAIEDRIVFSQGANDFGGFTRAMASLTFIPHLLQPVPEEDAVTMTFIASGNGKQRKGKKYTITLPWITEVPPAAVENNSTDFSIQNTPNSLPPQKLRREDILQSKDLWQEQRNQLLARYDLENLASYPSNPSAEPTLTWGIIENRYGNFGYLRLSSFVPATGNNATLAEIQRLLFEELAETKGLIFDIRDNGGGSVDLANQLYQFFARSINVESMGGRIVNSDLNRRLLNDTFLGQFFDPQWTENINAVEGSDRELTDDALYTAPSIVNRFGQFYYKPVAVLANASSYSASDLFACSMQDNDAAMLFGEEPRTGAGGANVWEHSLLNMLAPLDFPALPGNHRMRVAWGQIVRFGPSEGKIIEDFGCSADIDVSPSKSDLLNANARQIKTITKKLFLKGLQPRYLSAVVPSTAADEQTVFGSAALYKLSTQMTAEINVYINGEFRQVETVNSGFNPEDVELFIEDLDVGSHLITFEGINYRGKTAWNVKRNFLVFASDVVTVDEAGFAKDFSDNTLNPLTIFNENPAELGWQLVDGVLQLGYNPTYSNNIQSTAAAAFDLSALTSATLSVDFEFSTEFFFDSVTISAEDGEGNTQLLFGQTGVLERQTIPLDLYSFAGKEQVFLRFTFNSDISVVDEGAKLYGFTIQP